MSIRTYFGRRRRCVHKNGKMPGKYRCFCETRFFNLMTQVRPFFDAGKISGQTLKLHLLLFVSLRSWFSVFVLTFFFFTRELNLFLTQKREFIIFMMCLSVILLFLLNAPQQTRKPSLTAAANSAAAV